MISEARYLDGTYAPGATGWHEAGSPWKAERIARMVDMAGINVTTICEVGCGAGGILQNLCGRWPWRYFAGFDIAPKAIDLAWAKRGPNLTFSYGDLLSQDQLLTFDLMLCIDVFEHVADYIGFLTKLRERANYFVFHIPLDMSAFNVVEEKRLMDRRVRIGHLHYFSKATALATLKDCGYEIIQWEYTPSGFQTDWARKHPWRYWPVKALFRVAPDLAVRLFGEYSLLVLAKRK